MLRCVRLYTNSSGQVEAQEGLLEYQPADRGDEKTITMPVEQVFFKQTAAGTKSEWKTDAQRQFVITLQGHLAFETELGQRFEIQRGDILFTEETGGKGHRWQLLGSEPWVRMYVPLDPSATVPFLVKNQDA